MQISLSNIAVSFDGTPVLTHVNFDIHEKEKIALVGRNGCGKTTLLRVLTGQVEHERGIGDEPYGIFRTGNPQVGYLEQVTFANNNCTLLEAVLTAYGDVIDAENKLNAALTAMEQEGSDKNIQTYTYWHERYETLGGYTYLKECKTAIAKFGFAEVLDKPIGEFSGGQRTKIALLTTLLSRPDVMLLDEPTNHLDVDAVQWLENYLKSYKKACVIVSHDRMFLDRIVNVVYEIEYGEATRYNGNYSAFVAQKQVTYEQALADATEKLREIDRLQKLVERFRYKASKAAMAQAKLTQISRIGNVVMPTRCDQSTFRAHFLPERPTVNKSLVVEKLSFGYGCSLGEVDFTLFYGDKLGIIGANGCGKSTMVKTIVGKQRALRGSAAFGLHAKIGYFDQTETQSYSTSTLFDEFQSEFPQLADVQVRTALGAFLFSGEEVFKQVCDLSGGEKVRFALCKLLKHRPNVLVLDEPTNHMDIIGKETFEDILCQFPGTLLLVSHDRYLINKVCNKLLVFENGKANFYNCNYEKYEEFYAQKEQEKANPPSAHKQKHEKKVSEEKAEAKRKKRIAMLEQAIADIEQAIADTQAQMCLPEVVGDYVKILKLQKEVDEKQNQLSALTQEWEQLCLEE